MGKGLAIGIVLVVVIGLGATGYLFYDSANKIDVEVEAIGVDNAEYSLGGFKLDKLTLSIDCLVKTEGLISLSVDDAEFTLEIDGVDFGVGNTGAFSAGKETSDMNVTLVMTDVSTDQAVVALKLIAGTKVTMKITITSVTVYSIPISGLDIVTEKELTI